MPYNDSHLLEFDRAGKITASLVAAILGVDPNMSRQEAWRRIMGTAKETTNAYSQAILDHGVEFEAKAMEEFEVESGFLVLPGRFVPHPTIPWLGASPDGFTAEGIPVEVKAPAKKVYDTIPEHYKLQVLTQIECCDKSHGFFGCLPPAEVTDMPFWWVRVEREQKYFEETVCKELEMFYNEYIVKNVVPPRRSTKRGK